MPWPTQLIWLLGEHLQEATLCSDRLVLSQPKRSKTCYGQPWDKTQDRGFATFTKLGAVMWHSHSYKFDWLHLVLFLFLFITPPRKRGVFCTYTYYSATPGPRALVSSKTCSHSANNFSWKRACVVCHFLVFLAHEKERETTEGASESRRLHGQRVPRTQSEKG